MQSKDFSDAFVFIVRQRRLAKGLSKNALAERAGLHQTYIGLLERGKRNPSIDVAKSIAKALEISLSKLIAEAEALHENMLRPIKPQK